MTTQYVMIETRDPFGPDGLTTPELASELSAGAQVTVYLAQNAVLAVRKSATAAAPLTALSGKAAVWADDFSLRERGIRDDELAAGVQRASMDPLVDLILQPGCKVFWH
jgi:sulfur transfer complex TusBCD TusB component (DsrH family)